ncbi:MAG: hypothetical protein FWD67_00855 [Betaproteobacteria bacterium]|nr:hypothetical protein [Betaproteobacteria bacterium]
MFPDKNSNNSTFLSSQAVMHMLSAVSTLLILVWILKYCFYGIDFTDESFYLVWISNPFLYDASVTQFGYIYHPLFLILDGDVATFRQANILITFCLSWCLAYFFLKSLIPENSVQKVSLHILAAGLAATSFISFFHNVSWLPTPSYNSLAFQALLIVAIGLLLADKASSSKSAVGWVLIGVGGWLAFMAKPSTALALAVGVLACLVIARKFSVRMMLLAATSTLGLLLVSALLIDGSIFKFVERLRSGIEFARLQNVGSLEHGYSLSQILRIDDIYDYLETREKIAILFVAVTAFVATGGAYLGTKSGVTLSLLISSAFFSLTALLAFGIIQQKGVFLEFQGMEVFGIVFSAIAIYFVFGGKKLLSNIFSVQWGFALLFFAMPHIYAFGTNGNYWKQGASASIFWLLAGLTILSPFVREKAKWSFAIPLVLAAQAVTAALMQTGLERPYRQPQPLRLNDSIVEIGATGSNLVLSAGYAQYFEDAKAAAQKGGFEAGTPMIDLSGQSPGILYVLRALSIGQAWIIGGYSGSLNQAKAALSRTPCKQIATAWVLFEPDGPRSIPVELMHSLGAEFPANYKVAGSWQTAEGAGGYAVSRTQVLYSPVASDETLEACQAIRERGAK